MWFFARDYRAYREGRSDEKPSLLQIFQSTDCLTYFKMHLEYAVSLHVRPTKMPYSVLVIGNQTPKRLRPALDVADLAGDGALADDEATPKKTPKANKKPKAKAPQAPPKAPKPEPKPTPHAGGAGGGDAKGDAPRRATPEGGSGYPDNKFMARNDIGPSTEKLSATRITACVLREVTASSCSRSDPRSSACPLASVKATVPNCAAAPPDAAAVRIVKPSSRSSPSSFSSR